MTINKWISYCHGLYYNKWKASMDNVAYESILIILYAKFHTVFFNSRSTHIPFKTTTIRLWKFKTLNLTFGAFLFATILLVLRLSTIIIITKLMSIDAFHSENDVPQPFLLRFVCVASLYAIMFFSLSIFFLALLV